MWPGPRRSHHSAILTARFSRAPTKTLASRWISYQRFAASTGPRSSPGIGSPAITISFAIMAVLAKAGSRPREREGLVSPVGCRLVRGWTRPGSSTYRLLRGCQVHRPPAGRAAGLHAVVPVLVLDQQAGPQQPLGVPVD